MISQVPRAERRARLEAALPKIVEQLAAIGAKRIVLFGSLARGDVARSSDIDLIVVLDRPGRFMDRLTAGAAGAIADAVAVVSACRAALRIDEKGPPAA